MQKYNFKSHRRKRYKNKSKNFSKTLLLSFNKPLLVDLNILVSVVL